MEKKEKVITAMQECIGYILEVSLYILNDNTNDDNGDNKTNKWTNENKNVPQIRKSLPYCYASICILD